MSESVWLASGRPCRRYSVYLLIVWPAVSRWGATNEQIQQTFPGDDLIPNAALVATKAITIHARPEAIWPWLVQLGR
jgi:hypothetical protein